ncbi:MAG: DUF2461 domain-containing protein [Bacteroidetes bacterium]|nr:DUF2461 domain-containing protein [Bacteroidota bacterium]MCW5895306.1 DUF2461 domain-containing protein [Bacteroidota bacterium]
MAKGIPVEEDFYPPFEGFPKSGIVFLKRLKKNNNREWFQKHKDKYDENVKFPMQCLIAGLRHRLRDEIPELDFNPKRSIFRIYRDVRFSKNKVPYKTNIAASFELKGKKKTTDTPGLYVGIEPGSVFVGGGMYMPGGDQLKKIRKSIVEHPDEFLAVVNDKHFKKVFGGIMGENLLKAPLGFPKDHPMIEHLKHKQWFVGKEWEDESIVLSKKFEQTTAHLLLDIMPLVRWLIRVVT